jgi:glycosyltransferase involved in cell wall biosynthesis
MQPKIALVIVTRNRHERLGRTLQSLKKLRTRLAWELILVDNGSTDGTAHISSKVRGREFS